MKKDQEVIYVPQSMVGEKFVAEKCKVIKVGSKFFEIINENGKIIKCKKNENEFQLGCSAEGWLSHGVVYENQEQLDLSEKWENIFQKNGIKELTKEQKKKVFELILSF